MKKVLAVWTAAALAVMSLGGCGQSTASEETTAEAVQETEAQETEAQEEETQEGTQAESQEESLDKLVFTYVTAPLNVPTIIERNQNIFADAFADLGIQVEYAEITSGADQTQALASGDVQVLYAVGGTSVILSAANGADIKVLNMYSRSPKAFSMYSSDESLNSPESLAGKTIAGPVGTNLHELLVAYLAQADMTLEDVNYVNMSIPDAMAALEGGSIDAALIAGATAYQAEQSGFHMVTDGEGLTSAIIAVAVTEEFYQAHPEIIERLTQAQEDIISFMKENPQETMEIVAQELDLDVAAVEEMYRDYDFDLAITDEDKAGFQKTADFMLETEMIENPVDVNTLFIEE